MLALFLRAMCFARDVATVAIVGIVLAQHLLEFFRCSDASHVEPNFFVLGVALGVFDAKFSQGVCHELSMNPRRSSLSISPCY